MNANELYTMRQKMIDSEIVRLRCKLSSMALAQAMDKENYGYAADCERVQGLLNEINNFLGKY